MKDKTLAIVVLAGTLGFLWQMSEVLHQHTCWCDFAQPPGVGEIVRSLVFGLAAIGASLGLDVEHLVKGLVTRKDDPV